MRWSYSASRSFKECQRQWYFKNVVANARAKDPARKLAYRLSKLQTVHSWRGKIVDDVISKSIIPSINRQAPINFKEAKKVARDLYDRQLAFALRHPLDDPDLTVADEGDDFALFFEMEYGSQPSNDELAQAWKDIEQALHSLYRMDAIKALLKSAEYVVAQRPLQFDLMEGVTVLSYPDVVAFRKDCPPLIVDWKVHTFGQNDAALQLAIYAIALSRCKHNDFPADFACDAKNALLIEVQLLTGFIREHRMDADQIGDAEEYITGSAYEITCLTEGKKYADLRPQDFMTAAHAETCQRCAFRRVCWSDANAH